jgi:glycosyltransferase involved in cell wall biosynthesis
MSEAQPVATDSESPIPRSLRVLVVTNQWPSPEQPHRVLVARQVEGLERLGFDPEVLVVEGHRSRVEYLRAMRRVARLMVGPTRYDLVHAHTGHCGVVACAQLRYPVVLSYVGYDLDPESADRVGGPGEQARAAVERMVFRQLSRLVAATVTKSARGTALLPPGGRRRNTVIPGGVDRERFAPVSRVEARRRLRWTHEEPTVLFAADPARYSKRFELAQAVFDLARAEVPELRLAVTHGVPPEEMPLWMNAADVLLLTSRGEGSPNVVKEAMACDLPVVSVDVGDVRELVEGTRHCHVCAAEPEALAAAVSAVVRALPERSDGRARSVGIGLDAVSARIVGVYETATTRGPGMLGFLPRRRRRTASGPRRPRVDRGADA